MQHFVDGFIAQCRKHRLDAELILVEWNPPQDRPSLEKALVWPDDFGPAVVRIVTVPPDVHARFPHADSVPLFQMIGKNVGIRRSRGNFVLATNIDILFDDTTVIYLRDQLTPGTVLRVDRYDVPADLPKDGSFDHVLADCRNRFFQVNRRYGVFDVRKRCLVGMGSGIEARLLALYNEARIFGLAEPFSRIFARLFRYLAATPHVVGRLLKSCFAASGVTPKRMLKGIGGALHLAFKAMVNAPAFLRRKFPKVWPLRTLRSRSYWFVRRTLRRLSPRIRRPLRRVLNAPRSVWRSLTKAWRLMGPQNLFRSPLPEVWRFTRSQSLHTNACGDFTLLAREDWFRLRGYPEWPIFSWHIDSVFMFAADANDLKQVALGRKFPIFHIDHSVGSGWSPEGAALLFARLDRQRIPYLSDDDVLRIRKNFAEDPSAAIVNDGNWGLVDVPLPEREIVARKSFKSEDGPASIQACLPTLRHDTASAN